MPLKSAPFFSLAHILARLYSWLISNQGPFVSISQRLHCYRQDQITEGEREREGNRGGMKRHGEAGRGRPAVGEDVFTSHQ